MGNQPQSVRETVCMCAYERENGFATHVHITKCATTGSEGWQPFISAAHCLHREMTSSGNKEKNRSSCVQVIMSLPSVCICHQNARAPCTCHRGIIDVYEYSRMEMGQMLEIMARNNIFADES